MTDLQMFAACLEHQWECTSTTKLENGRTRVVVQSLHQDLTWSSDYPPEMYVPKVGDRGRICFLPENVRCFLDS
jgi:hypothetical protein